MKSSFLPAIAALIATACVPDYNIADELLPQLTSNPEELEDTIQVDRITQVTTPQTDVLWVIDNSCSMNCVNSCHSGSLADNIADNFEYFIDYFQGSGMDYHIGVITTDMDDPDHNGKLIYGPTVKYIDDSTIDPLYEFDEMAKQGTSGSGAERGFGTTFNTIELWADSYNSGFYREAGDLHTIVLSNEDDTTLSSFLTQNEFIDWYDDLKPEADMRTFNSIVCPTVGGSSACASPAKAGTKYRAAVNEIGGINWDIESEDWAVLLDSLGQQAAGLRREYFLSRVPVEDTVVVEVQLQNGVIQGNFVKDVDWTYTAPRNSVTFLEFVPEPLTTVVITYTVASTQVNGEVVESVTVPTP